MELILPELLKGVLLPAAATALVLAAGAYFCARRPGLAVVVTPVALLCGYAAAYVVILGSVPSVPPAEFWKWTLYLALPIAALSALSGWSRLPHWGKATALIAVAIVFAAGTIPSFESLSDTRTAWSLAVIALFVVSQLGATWAMKDCNPRGAAILLAIVLGGAGAYLGLAHTARFAQLCGVLASCAGGAFAVTLWRPRAFAVTSGVVFLSGMLLALVLIAMFYDASDIPHAAFICTGIAPAGFAFSHCIIRDRVQGIPRGILLLIGGLLPIAIAAAIVSSGAPTETGGEYDYGGMYE